jgi:hypothetical protein
MPNNDGKAIPTLFLCWSGQRSKQVAEALKAYFERIFLALEWTESEARVAMSETLIDKGAPWSAQLLKDLENARAGIVCLTPENRVQRGCTSKEERLPPTGSMGRMCHQGAKTPTNCSDSCLPSTIHR